MLFRVARAKPYKLVTWWDMEQFSAEEFYGIAVIIERQRARFAHKRTGGPIIGGYVYRLSTVELTQISVDFEQIGQKCKKLDLPNSEGAADYIKDSAICALHTEGTLDNRWVVQAIDNFQHTLNVETRNVLFLQVERRRKTYYEEPLSGWEEVTKRFPAAIPDIEESARCFACGRYGGTVFHAMLIAERGAVEVGELIEIKDPKPGWPSTIREMDRVVHRAKYADLSPVEQKYRPLLTKLLPTMQAMETGWRHKISHVEGRLVLLSGEFIPEIAEEILTATRGFMRSLAIELPDPAKPVT
jgi:hypothetical protein